MARKQKSNTLWKGFWQLADPKIWTASMVPFILGSSLAVVQGHSLRPRLILQALIVLILIEIGKNGVNEYFDYQSGADLHVAPQDRTSFSGGKKVIVDHLLTLREVAWISLSCFSLAILLSISIVAQNPGILAFGIAGVCFSIAYSAPPFKLSYHGWGEATVGFTFGLVIVNGAYYLHTGSFALEPVLLSIPLGFLIANVLWINEIPDVEADRSAGKMNLVARRGRQRALFGYMALFMAAGVALIAAILILWNFAYLLAFVGFLPVPAAIRCARQNFLDTQKLIKANGLTILVYALTGLLLSVSVFIK